MTLDSSLLEEFIAESREHLRAIEDDFILLEKEAAAPDSELVNRIFRAMHTIKGSSGFFGLKNIGGLSHAMEALLALVRDGALELSRTHIDTLLEGVDALNRLLDDIASSDNADIDPLVSRLEQAVRQTASGELRHSLERKFSVDVDGRFDISALDLERATKKNHHLYLLDFELASFEREHGQSPVRLVAELLKIGDIIDGYMPDENIDIRDGLPATPLHYRLLYATVLEPDLIGAAVSLDSDHITPIDRKALEKQDTAATNAPATPDQSSREPHRHTTSRMDAAGERRAKPSSATHETLRIRVDILDKLMMLAGELVLVRNQQMMHVNRQDSASRTIAQRLDVVTSDLQETIMRTRMQPIGGIFGKFSRIVRDLGRTLGKQIEIDMAGNDVELDKAILEELTDPLTHIIRNSCDHGIETPEDRRKAGKPETGTILLRAYHEGGQINVDITDDGAGIDREKLKRKALEKNLRPADELANLSDTEALALIFAPGFSTRDAANDLSGRGVGMDVVKTAIEKLGGVIDLQSEPQSGTAISLRLPLTLAIIPSVIVRAGANRYAIPQINLEEVVRLYDEDVFTKIEYSFNREVYRLREELLPLVRLEDVLSHTRPLDRETLNQLAEKRRERAARSGERVREAAGAKEAPAGLSLTFAVLKAGATRYGLIIDEVIGVEEIVVKPMHDAVKGLPVYAGATVLGDGSVALILDVPGTAKHAAIESRNSSETTEANMAHHARDEAGKSLLLFLCGPDEQFAVETNRIRRVEKIAASAIETSAGREYITVEGVSTRLLRLDDLLPVSSCPASEYYYVILPKLQDTAFGIVISRLVDIGEFAATVDPGASCGKGCEGSAILNGKMTLFIDLLTLASSKKLAENTIQ